MTHRLYGDQHHDRDGEFEVTAIPRVTAGFMTMSAKWTMALILSILISILGGGGTIIWMLLGVSSDMGEIKTTLREHSAKLVEQDKRLVSQEQITQANKEYGLRLMMHDQRLGDHTTAIVSANAALHELVLELSKLRSDVAENRANHLGIEKRLDLLMDNYANFRNTEDKAHHRTTDSNKRK